MQFDPILKSFFSFGDLPAFFYRIQESDGDEIENIARHLIDLDSSLLTGEASDKGTVELTYTFSLSSLIGNINTERFYTYRGD